MVLTVVEFNESRVRKNKKRKWSSKGEGAQGRKGKKAGSKLEGMKAGTYKKPGRDPTRWILFSYSRPRNNNNIITVVNVDVFNTRIQKRKRK